uniref:ARAD1D32758p n=1 Tax=Blastobotrys adeninivorans TaxID=409370 RepID=A0A060THP1_BLAAD
MQKTLAVIGATGKQGGSVVRVVLKDFPSYKVRAITRDPTKESSKELKMLGCEVVQGDSNDPESLKVALAGVDTLFFMTTPAPQPDAEYEQGKTIADAAVAAGVQFIIFSSLPGANQISGGKYKVFHFDEKFAIEQYIRSSGLNCTFVWPGLFAQNFFTVLKPRPIGNDVYAIVNCIPGHVKVPLVDISQSIGTFVASILTSPQQFASKTNVLAGGMYSFDDMAAQLSQSTGKKVVYKQLPESEYLLEAGLPEPMRLQMIETFLYIRDFSFAGSQTSQLVQQGQQIAKLNTLPDFLAANPISL